MFQLAVRQSSSHKYELWPHLEPFGFAVCMCCNTSLLCLERPFSVSTTGRGRMEDCTPEIRFSCILYAVQTPESRELHFRRPYHPPHSNGGQLWLNSLPPHHNLEPLPPNTSTFTASSQPSTAAPSFRNDTQHANPRPQHSGNRVHLS